MTDFDVTFTSGGLGLGGPTFDEETTTKKSKKSKKDKKKEEDSDEGEATGYAAKGTAGAGAVGEANDYVHIRNQQRNGRKSTTSCSGLPSSFNANKILKAFKKELNCNGCIIEDEKHGRVIQVQGDKRQEIARFLMDELQIQKSRIKVHGS